MHPHDEKWIKEQILLIECTDRRAKALAGYRDAYKKAFDREPVEHKKENKARREANTRLRLYISKFL